MAWKPRSGFGGRTSGTKDRKAWQDAKAEAIAKATREAMPVKRGRYKAPEPLAAVAEPSDDPFAGLLVETAADTLPALRRTRALKTDEAIEEILDLLSTGRLLIDALPDEDRPPHLPTAATWLAWVRDDEDLKARYTTARRLGWDIRAERLLRIAADEARDFVYDPETGRVKFDGHHVRRAETMINAEKWLLAKAVPEIYGERVQVQHSGGIEVAAASADDLAAMLIKLVGTDASAMLAPVIDVTPERVDDDDPDA